MSFPVLNGDVLTFGRDVNIEWKHGIKAEQGDPVKNTGRISIIAWGWVRDDGPPRVAAIPRPLPGVELPHGEAVAEKARGLRPRHLVPRFLAFLANARGSRPRQLLSFLTLLAAAALWRIRRKVGVRLAMTSG